MIKWLKQIEIDFISPPKQAKKLVICHLRCLWWWNQHHKAIHHVNVYPFGGEISCQKWVKSNLDRAPPPLIWAVPNFPNSWLCYTMLHKWFDPSSFPMLYMAAIHLLEKWKIKPRNPVRAKIANTFLGMWIFFNGYRTKYWNKRRFISTYSRQSKGYGRVLVEGLKKIPLSFAGQTRVNMAQLFEGLKILLVCSRSIDIFDKGNVSSRSCKPD